MQSPKLVRFWSIVPSLLDRPFYLLHGFIYLLFVLFAAYTIQCTCKCKFLLLLIFNFLQPWISFKYILNLIWWFFILINYNNIIYNVASDLNCKFMQIYVNKWIFNCYNFSILAFQQWKICWPSRIQSYPTFSLIRLLFLYFINFKLTNHTQLAPSHHCCIEFISYIS